jgi:hypothetical protein
MARISGHDCANCAGCGARSEGMAMTAIWSEEIGQTVFLEKVPDRWR